MNIYSYIQLHIMSELGHLAQAMSSYPQTDAGSSQQLVTPCFTSREASLHNPHCIRVADCISVLTTMKHQTGVQKSKGVWKDMSVLLVSFLFPTR